MDLKYGIAGVKQREFRRVFQSELNKILNELSIGFHCVEVTIGYDTLLIIIVCPLDQSVLDQLVLSIDVIMCRTKEVVNGSENYKYEIFNEPKF